TDLPAARAARAQLLLGFGFLSSSSGETRKGQAFLVDGLRLAADLPPEVLLAPELVARGYNVLANYEYVLGEQAGGREHSLALVDFVERWDREKSTPESRYWLGIARL